MKPNWSGAAQGAAQGAMAGSTFGAPGAVVGGTVGGLTGMFSGGTRDSAQKFNRLTPEAMAMYEQIIASLQGQGDGQFNDLYGPFNPQYAENAYQKGVVNPAMRNWNQNIAPGVMERFGDQGNSSALNNSMSAAGRDLQENLSNQASPFMYEAMLQNQQNRLQGVNTAMNTQAFSPYVQQGVPGPFQGVMEGAGNAAGQAGMSSLMELMKNFGQGSQRPNRQPYTPYKTSGMMTNVRFGQAGV